jgi:hypothetical protein
LTRGVHPGFSRLSRKTAHPRPTEKSETNTLG